jgi:hypothetical protein
MISIGQPYSTPGAIPCALSVCVADKTKKQLLI